jgi:hypothetical protein
LPVKNFDESAGEAFNKTGGRLSLYPPCGGIILAQPVSQITLIILIKKNKETDMGESFLIQSANILRITRIIRISWIKKNPIIADYTGFNDFAD